MEVDSRAIVGCSQILARYLQRALLGFIKIQRANVRTATQQLDRQIAEPGAEIGFAGKRVIEQTLREKLPEGFQTAEYLLEHGMVDMVVKRHDLPDTLATLLKILTKEAANDAAALPALAASA